MARQVHNTSTNKIIGIDVLGMKARGPENLYRKVIETLLNLFIVEIARRHMWTRRGGLITAKS